MTRAIRIHSPGGPEALCFEPVSDPVAGPGEAVIRQSAIGVNFIDVYHRSGLYPAPLPAALGMEGAGVVESVGPGVAGLSAGDRVAYASRPLGAYAEKRAMPADRLVKLPPEVTEEAAAALMLKGMTAEYLLHRTHVVGPGQTILVHAAAGGVGLLLCAWGKALGARVIGTVGSPEKAELARAQGCDVPILYREVDFAAEAMRATEGRGVDVIYDSVGKDTFLKGFDCLKPRGLMALYGQASGPVAPFDPGLLARGWHYLTRPSLFGYTASRDELELSAGRVFAALAAGIIGPNIRHRFALSEAAEAHRALEARQTAGAILLLP